MGRRTRDASRLMAALLPVALGVTLRGGGPEVGGLTSTEQLERAVRDINRLEATIESALPAYMRPSGSNASQIWSPLDEEQQREEVAVNAAVAAAAQEEAKAREQLAAARAQAAAVGARRHVRRFASAGSFGFDASPPASSPAAAAPPATAGDAAQMAQKLALEAQEAGRAALHAASLAMRMASWPTGAGAPYATPAAGLGTSLPLPLTQGQPAPTPRAEAPAEAAHIGEALAFEKPAAATPLPTFDAQPPPEAPKPAEATMPPLAPREASPNLAAIAAMRRAAGSWLPLPSSPGVTPLPSPMPPAVPLLPSARADAAQTPSQRTGASAGWMVRVALWGYLFVLAVVLCAVVVYGVARCAGLAADAVRRLLGRPEEPPEPPMLDAAALGLGLADGMAQAYGVGAAASCASAEGGAGVSVPSAEVPGRPKLNTPGYKPPPSAHGQQVMDLLRSGKQNFSVSESKAVANFLARQKDLLILCGDKKGGDK